MQGIFSAIEGPDGVGKTTIVELVKNKLLIYGKTVITTTEPTKTETGKEIRRVLSSNDPTQQSRLLELYLQDRKEHTEDFIIPNMEKYDFVLTDRYKHSSIVYQSIQNLSDIESIKEANSHFIVPDITFILFDTFDNLVKRLENRGDSREFLETESTLSKSINCYMNMDKILNGENIIYICNDEISKTVDTIIDYLIPLTKNKRA